MVRSRRAGPQQGRGGERGRLERVPAEQGGQRQGGRRAAECTAAPFRIRAGWEGVRRGGGHPATPHCGELPELRIGGHRRLPLLSLDRPSLVYAVLFSCFPALAAQSLGYLWKAEFGALSQQGQLRLPLLKTPVQAPIIFFSGS